MTRLFQQAISKVTQLSDVEQDAIAQIVLDEIESEKRWEELFAKSPEKLSKLADQAWAKHESGASEALDPDQL